MESDAPRQTATEKAPLWAQPAFFAAAVFVYVAAHFAVRMAMWHSLGIDDAEQALTAQKFAWSYRQSSPPLFAWLLLATSHLTGANIVSISIVRYACFAATFGFCYAAARLLIVDVRLAALSVYSFAVIYMVGFYSHHDLTHSAVMVTMLAASLYTFVRLARTPTLGWYLVLGLVFGLGLLGKWNFVMFAGALALACLLVPTYRPLVLTWKAVAAAIVCALIVAPTVATALIEAPNDPISAGSLLTISAESYMSRVMEGSYRLLDSAVRYPQPALLLILAVFAPPLWRGLRGSRLSPHVASRPDAALLGLTIALSLGLHLALVLAIGAQHIYTRLMLPPLFILPVVVFMLIERGCPSTRAINLYAVALAILVPGFFVARIAVYEMGADYCNKCRNLQPFHALADDLRAAGFKGAGTILAGGAHLAGNMRVEFPDARVVEPAFPPSAWPAPRSNDGCLIVRRIGADETEGAAAGSLGRYLSTTLGGDPDAPHQSGVLSELMFHSTTRRYRIEYALYDSPNGNCR